MVVHAHDTDLSDDDTTRHRSLSLVLEPVLSAQRDTIKVIMHVLYEISHAHSFVSVKQSPNSSFGSIVQLKRIKPTHFTHNQLQLSGLSSYLAACET